MKKLFNILLLSIITLLISCDDINILPVSVTFDSPFPKRNKYLTNILGDELSLKSGNDTLNLKIASGKNSNLITDAKNGDTIFYGTVSKFRGLYYFSQKLSDTSYLTYSVKISGKLIYGLNSAWIQMLYLDESIKNGENKKLVKYINSDSSLIRLHADKYDMRKAFSSIINKLEPDTIISSQKEIGVDRVSDTEIETNPKDFNLISKVYPNPVKDAFTIELQEKAKNLFQLRDMNGKIIQQGEINETEETINISKEKPGTYLLLIMNPIENEEESIKIVKID